MWIKVHKNLLKKLKLNRLETKRSIKKMLPLSTSVIRIE